MAKKKRTKEEQRRYTMSRIRSRDTKIEVILRKALWREGIRYRKNASFLPGKPDIAITRDKIAVFCDGEFWHGKNWGKTRDQLGTNRDFWIRKIERNIQRDNENDAALFALGWTIVRIWGREIEKDLEGCVETIKDIIFQTRLDDYTAKTWEIPDIE